MNKETKDNIVLLLICYFVAFLFCYQYHNSIYTQIDYIIFMVSFTLMLVLPIVVFELRFKKKEVDS